MSNIIRSPLRPVLRSPLTPRKGVLKPTGLLRAASPMNVMPGLLVTVSGSSTGITGRWPAVVGSGDAPELRALINNFALSAVNVVTPGNTFTLTDLFLEDATGASPPVRATFGGSNSVTLANGAVDIVSDAVPASAFGKTKFSRDSVWYWRYIGTVPTTSSKFCLLAQNFGLHQCGRFNPASTTVNNIASNGPITVTGTALTNSNALSIITLAKFTTGDPMTLGGIGTSIVAGSFGDAGGYTPSQLPGFFYKALWAAGAVGVSGAVGGINFGLSGGKAQMWNSGNASLIPLSKYCNTFLYEYGRNDFGSGANSATTRNALIGQDRYIWSLIRGAAQAGGRAVKIGRTELLPATTGAWSLADGSDQTPLGPQWISGGDVELYNASNLADVGVSGRVDAFIQMQSLRLSQTFGSDAWYKWGLTAASTPRTQDGTHPYGNTTTGTTLYDMAALVKAWLATLL